MKILNLKTNENNMKGITLVALVITIIVLLILATVSISLVINNGILDKAKYAVDKYHEGEISEQDELLKAQYEMEKYSGSYAGSYDSYILDKKYGLKIGDYVAYDHKKDKDGNILTTEYTSYSEESKSDNKNDGRTNGYTENQVFNVNNYSGGWRVLGLENGKVKIISATSIGNLTLQGQDGYKYSEEELNAISNIYAKGKGAESGRSINEDDLNTVTGYNPYKTGDGQIYSKGNNYQYGNQVTYYWKGDNRPFYSYEIDNNKKTGILNNNHNNGFDYYENGEFYSVPIDSTATNTETGRKRITTLTATYYFYIPTTLTSTGSGEVKGLQTNSTEYKLLFGSRYWLASRCIVCGNGTANYYLKYVDSSTVNGNSATTALYYSDGREGILKRGIRPVVTLSSNIKIIKNSTNDGSTQAKACIIE